MESPLNFAAGGSLIGRNGSCRGAGQVPHGGDFTLQGLHWGGYISVWRLKETEENLSISLPHKNSYGVI